ncbi:hypothetical protein C8J56DRAFT_1138755 [Mycena floridula]|nr:hypothetical protein C8J56DRAFT_1138755 [Mycena floridula]
MSTNRNSHLLHALSNASTLERDSDLHPPHKKLKLASEPDDSGKILEKPDSEFAAQLLSSLANISEGIQVLIPKGKVPLPRSDPLWDLYDHCWTQKLEPVRPEEGQLPVPLNLPFYQIVETLPFMGSTNGYLLIRKAYKTIADSILPKGVEVGEKSPKGHIITGQSGIGNDLSMWHHLIRTSPNSSLRSFQGISKIVLQPFVTKELAACAYYTSHFKLSNLYKAATTKEQFAALLQCSGGPFHTKM